MQELTANMRLALGRYVLCRWNHMLLGLGQRSQGTLFMAPSCHRSEHWLSPST